MNNPTVSIIVPNYNYEQYLSSRIESILNQTYRDFELILLDDCSTDDSREILESYRDNPHVSHIVFNEKNTGSPFCQWMKGIELARGKYVWIAEADDLAHPEFLSRTINLLNSNTSAVIAFTGSFIIDENGKTVSGKDFDRWTKKQLRCKEKFAIFNGINYATKNQYWKNYIYNASGVVFKKDTFFNITNSNWIDMRCCGDWLFWTLIALQGDVIEIYERLNYFRRHSTSAVASAVQNGRNFEESIHVIHQLEQYLPGLSKYRRHINHGGCYKHVNRHLSGKRKQELIDLMENLFGNMKFPYYFAKLIKLFFNPRKWDRCTP